MGKGIHLKAKCDIGLIGLAVMGENLVLNMAGKGFQVAVFNRTAAVVDKFIAGAAAGLPVQGYASLAELVAALERPRRVMLMVKAGKPVDDVIEQVLPFLGAGDIVIDGGNSFFQDTRRRYEALRAKGIRFVGMGVSGGEEGALRGPSLMPGGDLASYTEIAPLFTRIAAQVADGPCCSFVGTDGAGHYVKMVHNGIEYSDMQLIAEAYHILRQAGGLNAAELHGVFARWNEGPLDSYLIEITRDIMAVADPESGRPLVEMILDKAGQKGTGKWTSQNALDLGVPTPAITEAVFARCMSAVKDERVKAATVLKGPQGQWGGDREQLVQAVHDALYASKICSYAQGFALLAAAGKEYGWDLKFGDIALLWRGGCIIRARFLDKIRDAFVHEPTLANLMLDPFFTDVLASAQESWRFVLKLCRDLGIPAPAFNASLDYYDAYRQAVLPANLIQAQRDYFGAHTYERIDRPGSFHTEWTKQ
jgi:6-phosphogluconate dehydrogenase